MATVKMSSKVPVTADQLWEAIGHFNALPDWHPAVQKSDLEEGGSIRRLTLAGGGEIVERLEQSSDGDGRSYSYSILESPLPVAGYTASIKVTDDDAGGCTIEWSSSFAPSGAPENDAIKVIEGIYQAGFDNLKKMFGG